MTSRITTRLGQRRVPSSLQVCDGTMSGTVSQTATPSSLPFPPSAPIILLASTVFGRLDVGALRRLCTAACRVSPCSPVPREWHVRKCPTDASNTPSFGEQSIGLTAAPVFMPLREYHFMDVNPNEHTASGTSVAVH